MEGVVQRPLVHDRTASDIDEVCSRGEGSQDAFVDQVRRFGRVGHRDHEELGVTSKVREVAEPAEPLEACRLPPLLGRVLGHGGDAHPDEGRPACDFAADVAEPDDQQGPAAQLAQWTAAPASFAQVVVGSEELTVQRRHGHEHVLGDAVVVPVDVAHEHARRQRVEDDPVVAGADRVDQPEA